MARSFFKSLSSGVDMTGVVRVKVGTVAPGFHTKVVGEYIDLFQVPANAVVYKIGLWQTANWAGQDGFSPQFDGTIVNNLSDTMFPGTFIFGLNGDVPPGTPTFTGWRKESSPTTVRFKIDNINYINPEDGISWYYEYIQE